MNDQNREDYDLDAESADDFNPLPTLGELIADLAKMSQIDYDLARKSFAKEHGLQLKTLDAEVDKMRHGADDSGESNKVLFEEVEPWDDPVNGADMLDAIQATIERFCILPMFSAELVAVWIVHAWAHDAADISPVLAFTSPEKRCGKSTALAVVGAMTPKAEHTVNMTTSVLFRLIEKHKPTVIIDEADTFLEAREEMRGIINGGHNRLTSYVWRSVGDDHEPTKFRVWSPKAVAMIGDLPGTLEDRSIVVPLKRKDKGEIVERFHARRGAELLPIRRMLARWTDDNQILLTAAEPNIPDELNDRAQDNARCLCAIADMAGGNWPRKIRVALIGSAAARLGDEPASKGVMLLHDIGGILERWTGSRINSQDLVAEMVDDEDGPWAVWRGGEPITVRMVAALLKPYDVRPDRDRNVRFYVVADLKEAVERYAT